MIASALLNKAGVINVVLGFMILIEAFPAAAGDSLYPPNDSKFSKIESWLLGSALINLLVALVQTTSYRRLVSLNIAHTLRRMLFQGYSIVPELAVCILVRVYSPLLVLVANAMSVLCGMRVFGTRCVYQMLISDSSRYCCICGSLGRFGHY
jgi:hypothetical protein